MGTWETLRPIQSIVHHLKSSSDGDDAVHDIAFPLLESIRNAYFMKLNTSMASRASDWRSTNRDVIAQNQTKRYSAVTRFDASSYG